MIKNHPITIICKWLTTNKECVIQDELYYFIIDMNSEQIVSIIHDKSPKEMLTAFDTSGVEEHIQKLFTDRYHYIKTSSLDVSDTIAYPFVFYGIDDNHHFIYDWYFFWFNLSKNSLGYVDFSRIKDNFQ